MSLTYKQIITKGFDDAEYYSKYKEYHMYYHDNDDSFDRRHGFTLNELLVVIVIIVLMIAIALPAFNIISGTNSVASSRNQISAFLGQARNESLGLLQEQTGVMFFRSRESGRVSMGIVRVVKIDANDVYYLDLASDRDIIDLPYGVGLQTIDNPVNNNSKFDDNFLGYNSAPIGDKNYFGGVILFNTYGKLIFVKYGFKFTTNEGGTHTSLDRGTRLASYLATGEVGNDVGMDDWIPSANSTINTNTQFGIALYLNKEYPGEAINEDWQIVNSSTIPIDSDEINREKWIMENALLLLIDRFNGTLLEAN